MYALRQIEAVYSWHHDIGNNNIESIPIKLLKRLIAITGLFHLNSHQLEVDCKCLEIKRVVLDEQNSGHTGKAPQSTDRSTRREWLIQLPHDGSLLGDSYQSMSQECE